MRTVCPRSMRQSGGAQDDELINLEKRFRVELPKIGGHGRLRQRPAQCPYTAEGAVVRRVSEMKGELGVRPRIYLPHEHNPDHLLTCQFGPPGTGVLPAAPEKVLLYKRRYVNFCVKDLANSREFRRVHMTDPRRVG